MRAPGKRRILDGRPAPRGEPPVTTPPGYEEIQRQEIARLFGKMTRARLWLIPLFLGLFAWLVTRTDVPFVLQDYPQLTGVTMTAPMIARMAAALLDTDPGDPTGSEVAVALECAEELEAKGIGADVVSMPSWERYREAGDSSLLPADVLKVSIEAASTFGWERIEVGPSVASDLYTIGRTLLVLGSSLQVWSGLRFVRHAQHGGHEQHHEAEKLPGRILRRQVIGGIEDDQQSDEQDQPGEHHRQAVQPERQVQADFGHPGPHGHHAGTVHHRRCLRQQQSQ